MTNREIARKLQEHARELSARGANLYRARACRQAALAITGLTRELEDVFATAGRDGLEALPGIGAGLGYTLEAILRTGQPATLHGPEVGQRTATDFGGLPGVGLRALERIKNDLGIVTLDQLRAAGEAGQLDGVIRGKAKLAELMAEVRARLAELQQRTERGSESAA